MYIKIIVLKLVIDICIVIAYTQEFIIIFIHFIEEFNNFLIQNFQQPTTASEFIQKGLLASI